LSDQYLVRGGFVQKFRDKPAVVTRDYNGGSVRDFTIKLIGTDALVRVSVFDSIEAPEIEEGDLVFVDGKLSSNEHNGTTYHNLTANSLAVVKGCKRKEREVSNPVNAAQAPPAASSDSAPF
jgi:hypothetical protein